LCDGNPFHSFTSTSERRNTGARPECHIAISKENSASEENHTACCQENRTGKENRAGVSPNKPRNRIGADSAGQLYDGLDQW
jgi:hypothetical protein